MPNVPETLLSNVHYNIHYGHIKILELHGLDTWTYNPGIYSSPNPSSHQLREKDE